MSTQAKRSPRRRMLSLKMEQTPTVKRLMGVERARSSASPASSTRAARI